MVTDESQLERVARLETELAAETAAVEELQRALDQLAHTEAARAAGQGGEERGAGRRRRARRHQRRGSRASHPGGGDPPGPDAAQRLKLMAAELGPSSRALRAALNPLGFLLSPAPYVCLNLGAGLTALYLRATSVPRYLLLVPLSSLLLWAVGEMAGHLIVQAELDWLVRLPFPVVGWRARFEGSATSRLTLRVRYAAATPPAELVMDLTRAVDCAADGGDLLRCEVKSNASAWLTRRRVHALGRRALEEVLVPLHAVHAIASVEVE